MNPQAPGTLVLVVGPSGAGKDTLMRLASARLDPDRFVFAARFITRPTDRHEHHVPVTQAEFEALRERGTFAFHWQAHGLSYAVPAEIGAKLAEGRHVIVNCSRALVPELAERYGRLRVVLVSASPDLLRARLAARGREDGKDVASRMERPVLPVLPPDVTVTPIDNSETPEAGTTAFVACLQALDTPSSPLFRPLEQAL